ncbi:N-carbamoylsarcosine amidase [Hypericibacter adhaerens]|uniref:N-carbamoylsarcosine amidase n=2 Tax=Hypericibacter adhaerens TaxID=2602016 RepID=A0A5J6N5L2_9PROT|nr:N-carbamoylsarcosine amidase [Hypericibacter adhaerens]
MASQATSRIYETAGFGRRVSRGPRPAILVVDFSYGFTDTSYPTAADMTAQVVATRRLLDAGRKRSVPIVFTTIGYDEGQARALAWLRKAPGMAALRHGTRLIEIDERLGRRVEEPLLVKAGASAFFGTNLAGLVASWRADTLIVTGATTSGCVRASVVDAVQHGYDVLVPEECVADRASAPHQANLFDMGQKYADVISLDEVLGYIETVQGLLR